MELLDLIPFGHENAITRKNLAIQAGLPDRVMRKEILKLREDNIILNLQDGRGYFRPNESETDLIHRWMRQTASRARECKISLSGAQKWLLNQKQKPLDGQTEVSGCRVD